MPDCCIGPHGATLVGQVASFANPGSIIRYPIMTEVTQIFATLKRQLKLQGKTYRDVAAATGLSEPSVKRLFSSGTLSIDRLVEVCSLLGFTLAELAQQASIGDSRLRTLSSAQQKELMSDPLLLLLAVCALNHWTLQDMLAV